MDGSNILTKKLEEIILKKYHNMSLDQVKNDIDRIVNSFSMKPWVLQKNILKK